MKEVLIRFSLDLGGLVIAVLALMKMAEFPTPWQIMAWALFNVALFSGFCYLDVRRFGKAFTNRVTTK
jgi:hypothetical protein